MNNICLITTGCVNFRTKLFEILEKELQSDFYFHGTHRKFNEDLGYISNYKKISPSIFSLFYFLKYDVIIKCVNNQRFLLLITLFTILFRKKLIIWSGVWYYGTGIKSILKKWIYMFVYANANSIVVYGDHIKQHISSLHPFFEKKIFVAYQAVKNELFNLPVSKDECSTLKEYLDIRTEDIILVVARLEKSKGIHQIIEAYCLLDHNSISLLLIGDGSEYKNILQKIALNKLNNVRIIKRVESAVLYKYYALASVLCLFSVTDPLCSWKEPWGVVLNEALNQGLPCIASDAVGAAVGGLIKHGVNGFVVKENDTKALSVAFQTLFSDKQLIRTLESNARSLISKWTYDRMAAGFLDAVSYVKNS